MKKIFWQELRRPEFEAVLQINAVVIIPVASTEQHGAHLPVNTDANICYTVAQRAAQETEEFPVLVLPVIWMGYSPHHMAFPGTITLKFHTFVDVLSQVATSIYEHGFKRILFLNGHGGNAPMVNAMRRELAAQRGMSVVGYNYWQLPGVAEEMKAASKVDKGALGHAGEMETSAQLYLQPELVDAAECEWGPGVKGDPSSGTCEEGERVINAAVRGLVKILADYHRGILEENMVQFRQDIIVDEGFRPIT
jgi:creatinine amidohydrolase